MSLSSYAEIISKAFEEKNWNYVSENSADEKIQFGINFESKKYKAIYCKIEMFDDGICDIEAELPVKCPMLNLHIGLQNITASKDMVPGVCISKMEK